MILFALSGARDVLVCGIAQYSMLWVTAIAYTITAATSMMWVMYLSKSCLANQIMETLMQLLSNYSCFLRACIVVMTFLFYKIINSL